MVIVNKCSYVVKSCGEREAEVFV